MFRWWGLLLIGWLVLVGCQGGPTPSMPTDELGALERNLSAPNPGERAAAAARLLARDDRQSKAMVRRYLSGSGPEGARAALIDAVRVEPRPEYAELVVTNLASPSRMCRESASQTAATFDDKAIFDPLVKELAATRTDIDAQRRVIALLGKTGQPRAVQPLLDSLGNDQVRDASIAALQRITGQEFQTAEEWRQWWSRNRGENPVEWYRRRLAQEEADNESLRAQLAAQSEKLRPTESGVEDFILRTLQPRDDKPAAPDLLIGALALPYPKVRSVAAAELGRQKAVEAAAELTRLAGRDESPAVRASAVTALVQIDAAGSAGTLVKALADPAGEVAAAAATGLGRTKAKEAVEPLLTATGSQSPAVRAAAAAALGEISDANAVQTLVNILENDNVLEVRESAAKALGTLADPRALPALVKTLEASDASLRVYAVDALGALADKSVVPRVSEMLVSDENSGVRESAAVALGKLRDPTACPALRRAIKGNDGKLAQLAFVSLTDVCRGETELLNRTTGDLMTEGDYARASRLLEILLEQIGGAPEQQQTADRVRTDLSRCYLAMEKYAEAVKLLEALRQADPGNLAVQERYAAALAGLRKWPEAFRQYSELARNLKDPQRNFWPERLKILETMLTEKNWTQVMALVDQAGRTEKDIPTDVQGRLTEVTATCRKELETQANDNAALAAKLVAELGSEEATVRDDAVTKLRELGREGYPALVEGLASTNLKVRQAAFQILRSVGNQTMEYKPDGTEAERARALGRWRQWVKTAAGVASVPAAK